MRRELMERTVRDWVSASPARGARDLGRLSGARPVEQSPKDIADALIELAARLHIAETRIW